MTWCNRRSLIGCTFVPSNGAIYCAQCADHVTDNVIGGGVISVSASSDSLAGASRDNNVISRQAAINTTSHAHAAAAACFRHHSPDGSGSNLAADCSQDSAESSRRRSHVTVSGGARVGMGVAWCHVGQQVDTWRRTTTMTRTLTSQRSTPGSNHDHVIRPTVLPLVLLPVPDVGGRYRHSRRDDSNQCQGRRTISVDG